MDTRIVLSLAVVLASAFAGDPCRDGQHQVISDGHRSVSFIPGRYDSLICDKYVIVDGTWYRFKHRVGGTLPESCVGLFHCGTQAPIWMNGHHPVESGETVSRQICANFGLPGNCCSWSADILVKRCYDRVNSEDYFVYRLVSVPGCSIGYCAGDKVPCPAEYVYNNRTQKCEDLHPEIGNVTLLPPKVEDNFVRFYCLIDYNNITIDDGASFEVNFYFDAVKHLNATRIISSPQKSAYLEEKWLRHKMGQSLSCGVRAFWQGYEEFKSTEIYSDSYYIGLLVEPREFNVSEQDDKPQKIQVKSTIPITCKSPNHHGRCELSLKVVTPKRLVASQGGDQVGYMQCNYKITRESWIEDESLAYNESEPLVIMVQRDAYINDGVRKYIHFEPMPDGVPDYIQRDDGSTEVHYQIWDGYTLPDLPVKVEEDKRMGTCHSTTDPRMRTWDGWGYDILHRIGEFKMWVSNSSRNFEVHVRHWLCREAWFVACTCGVAVKEGNAILAVDMCGGRQKSTPRPKVTQIGTNNLKGASVTRDVAGKMFSINMPSGAYVKMEIHDWGMNVYAYAPSEDIGKTEGLCGTFDGNQDNDLKAQGSDTLLSKDEFIESWRIPPGESLFDKIPEDIAYDEPEQNAKFCTCKGDRTITCDWREKIDPVLEVGKPMIEVNPLKIKHLEEDDLSRRRRRSTHGQTQDRDIYEDDIDEVKYDFDYGAQPLVPHKELKWPTEGGITEAMALSHCEATMRNATSYDICNLVPNVDNTIPIRHCMEDIKLMDDLSWAENGVSEMEYQCLTSSQQVTRNNSVASAISPSSVVRFMCPNQCSGKGHCVNSVCQCNQGFDGADCSLIEGQAPKAKYIPNDGLCDILHRPCLKTRIIVEGLKDSPLLSCRIRQVEIIDGVKTVSESSGITNSTMISLNEAVCDLPLSPVKQGVPGNQHGITTHGMQISVSNDGINFSNELFFTIFDSICQSCQPGGDCTVKSDSCVIDGHCFAPGEANPENWCQHCHPDRSRNNFVSRQVNEKPVFESPYTIKKLQDEVLEFPIMAQDPEERPVTFKIIFTTDQHVAVNNSAGILQWSSSHNVRLEVEAKDECNASASHDFELKVVECHCQNGGQCVPDPSQPRGQGHYACDCLSGYSGNRCEVETNECLSSPCVHGFCIDKFNEFKCECRNGYTGNHCDEIIPLPSFEEKDIGKWSEWGEYPECSRPCDYGIQVRQRTCKSLPCSGTGSQIKECNADSCGEAEDEKKEGIVLMVDDTPVANVRQNEGEIINLIKDFVNDYCINQPAICCQMVETESNHSNDKPIQFEDSMSFYFGSGYPKFHSETLFSLKLIGKINKNQMQKACLGEVVGRKRRSAEDLVIFMDPVVLKEGVANSLEDIDLMYNVNVEDVIFPEEMPKIYIRKDDSDKAKDDLSTQDFLWIVGGCVVATIIICVIALATGLMKRRKRKQKTDTGQFVKSKHCPERSNSRKYLTKNDVMEDTEVQADSTSPSAAASRASTLTDKFFYQYVEEENPQNDDGISRTSTVRGEYFYKYAVNEGLGQVDNIDSSGIHLHDPSQCKFDSMKSTDLQDLSVSLAPINKGSTNLPPFDPHQTTDSSEFTLRRAPTRMSKKKSKMYAWKLFN